MPLRPFAARRTDMPWSLNSSRASNASSRCALAPSGRSQTQHARLVIHHNQPGPPSLLTLEGTLPHPPATDLTAFKEGAQCSYRRAGGSGGLLHVRFRLLLTSTDPDTAIEHVRITATSTSGLAADYRSAVSTPTKPQLSTATFTLKPAHFGHTRLIVVTVDPANEIPENNENNNQTSARPVRWLRPLVRGGGHTGDYLTEWLGPFVGGCRRPDIHRFANRRRGKHTARCSERTSDPGLAPIGLLDQVRKIPVNGCYVMMRGTRIGFVDPVLLLAAVLVVLAAV